VIRDEQKVERAAQRDPRAVVRGHRVAARELVGLVRTQAQVPAGTGIGRPAAVDVGVAPEHVGRVVEVGVGRVLLGLLVGVGDCKRCEDHCDEQPRTAKHRFPPGGLRSTERAMDLVRPGDVDYASRRVRRR
jgi:hypothetical protein